MPRKTKFDFQKTNGAYSNFWIKFREICLRKQAPVWPPTPPFQLSNVKQQVHLKVNNIIHLKSWPYTRVPGSTIDILIESLEVFTQESSELIHSNVLVSYYQTKNEGGPAVLENIHYDFDKECESCHPVFHAQLTPRSVNWRKCESFTSAYRDTSTLMKQEEAGRKRKKVEGLRIPTPHMNLISVLFCLTADHLGAGTLLQLRECASDNLDLPKIKLDRLTESISADAHSYRSLHWYQE